MGGESEIRPETWLFQLSLSPKSRLISGAVNVLSDIGVLVKISFILYLRNSSYSGEFSSVGKLEMVCLSHWVDMFQIIFLEI